MKSKTLRLFPYMSRKESFDEYLTYSLRFLKIVECDCVVLCSEEFFQIA